MSGKSKLYPILLRDKEKILEAVEKGATTMELAVQYSTTNSTMGKYIFLWKTGINRTEEYKKGKKFRKIAPKISNFCDQCVNSPRCKLKFVHPEKCKYTKNNSLWKNSNKIQRKIEQWNRSSLREEVLV